MRHDDSNHAGDQHKDNPKDPQFNHDLREFFIELDLGCFIHGAEFYQQRVIFLNVKIKNKGIGKNQGDARGGNPENIFQLIAWVND